MFKKDEEQSKTKQRTFARKELDWKGKPALFYPFIKSEYLYGTQQQFPAQTFWKSFKIDSFVTKLSRFLSFN